MVPAWSLHWVTYGAFSKPGQYPLEDQALAQGLELAKETPEQMGAAAKGLLSLEN